VPQLEKLIDADRTAGRRQDQRLRVGLFSYSERVLQPTVPAAPTDTTVGPSTNLPRSKRSKGARS
jgi:hypothetical protein